MPQIIAGAVNNPATSNYPDGSNPTPTIGRQGDQLVSDYNARYHTPAVRGALFHGCGVVAGNSFPLYTATAFVFGLWNKSPLVNLSLVSFKCGYVSGTGIAGPIGYNTKDVGLAVGVPLSAFNHTASGIRPGLIGGGAVSKAGFSNAATNTVVAAAAADFIPANMNMTVITAADATRGVDVQEEYFDGSIVLAPGQLFWPAALLASVSLFAMRLTWIEVPVGA